MYHPLNGINSMKWRMRIYIAAHNDSIGHTKMIGLACHKTLFNFNVNADV